MSDIRDGARPAPFHLDEAIEELPAGRHLRPVTRLLEDALGLTALNRLYGRLHPHGQSFWSAALEALGASYEVDPGGISRVPRSGPLVIVANHPFGAIEGLVLMAILLRVRTDAKLMANHLLGRIPELRAALLAVDPFNHRARRHGNGVSTLKAIRWLKSGGALVVFPAGEVGHAFWSPGVMADPDWSPGVARIIEASGAAVLPVLFHGRNSRLFRLAGRIHPRLRTALLPRELLNQRRRKVRVTIGSSIPASRLARFGEPERLIEYLRVRTYALASAESAAEACATPALFAPVAEPAACEVLEKEVRALRPSQTLLRNGQFDVCMATAAAIPHVLDEIGRLREIAFRAVGEGSGKSRDLDRFDDHYQHLFVWNRERRELAGAYRIGATDVILPALGVPGLYTSTLFRYDARLLAQIDPALELGRAFVAPQYQRDYSPLLLLWKAIAAYVHRNPRYRLLFGPVSISSSYQSLSRQILARFLYATSYREDLADLVRPRNPPAFLRHRGTLLPVAGSIVKTLAEVGSLLAEIESDHKGVPVLLRQYLRLNARLLGFNVDSSFGGVLDGLMLVDLVDVDRSILARYMGADAAREYLSGHGTATRQRAS